MATADQAEALTTGRIDAGILHMPIDWRGLLAVTVSHDPFMVAVPSRQPIAGWRGLTVQDLDR